MGPGHSKEFTPGVTSTILDILIAIMDAGPTPHDFVRVNIGRVQAFLSLCFNMDDPELQKKLKSLLQMITKWYNYQSPPATFVESRFYAYIKDIMEKKLIVAINEKVKY